MRLLAETHGRKNEMMLLQKPNAGKGGDDDVAMAVRLLVFGQRFWYADTLFFIA